MALVVFYEKPGCSGNARQKALLCASGHRVVARSIVETRWTRLRLLAFLRLLPVAHWFNRNSPRVKSGEIVPEDFDDADAVSALGLLQADPLLIRRPLLEVDGECRAGFDVAAIRAWIGLAAIPREPDESGPRTRLVAPRCSAPDAPAAPCTDACIGRLTTINGDEKTRELAAPT